jgi:hypothetical protein
MSAPIASSNATAPALAFKIATTIIGYAESEPATDEITIRNKLSNLWLGLALFAFEEPNSPAFYIHWRVHAPVIRRGAAALILPRAII